MITAIFRQFKVIRHHDRFRRTNLRTQIAKNANFKIDIIRINDFPFFRMGPDVFFPLIEYNLSDKYSHTDYKQYTFPDKTFESPETDPAAEVAHWIIISNLFPRQVL